MKRKSVAQLRNEIESITSRLKAIEVESNLIRNGEYTGNPKTGEAKLKSLLTEETKLKHKLKRVQEELSDSEFV